MNRYKIIIIFGLITNSLFAFSQQQVQTQGKIEKTVIDGLAAKQNNKFDAFAMEALHAAIAKFSIAKNVSYSDSVRFNATISAIALLDKTLKSYQKKISYNNQQKIISLKIEIVRLKKRQWDIPVCDATWAASKVGMKFVYIPNGIFKMGMVGSKETQPVHRVTIIKPFWIGKYEVTQQEYEFIMGKNPSFFKDKNKPVETVSWNAAVEFCQKMTKYERKVGHLPSIYEYRLLTEAEWEYVARGGSKRQGYKYSGSNNINKVAWYSLNAGKGTHKVGTKSPNELGVYDMSGNVSEWCLDDWNSSYQNAPSNEMRWGDGLGSKRVLRGGSWLTYATNCRSGSREWNISTASNKLLGFRVCLVNSQRQAQTIKVIQQKSKKEFIKFNAKKQHEKDIILAQQSLIKIKAIAEQTVEQALRMAKDKFESLKINLSSLSSYDILFFAKKIVAQLDKIIKIKYISVYKQQQIRELKKKIEVFKKTLFLPHELRIIPSSHYASLAGLAPESKKALVSQKKWIEKLNLPLEVITYKSKIKFRLIPPGTFLMGKNRTVFLTKPFYCGKFEITDKQWKLVMRKSSKKVYKSGSDYPITHVSWDECQEFLNQICILENVSHGTYRLLTEAEWEYACRAGTTSSFCYGDALDAGRANFNGKYPYNASKYIYRRKKIKVGSFKPNAFGLYDMHGNVAEWCNDWYGILSNDIVINPKGVRSSEAYRVYRGGSWNSHGSACRSDIRNSGVQSSQYTCLGLRIMRSILSKKEIQDRDKRRREIKELKQSKLREEQMEIRERQREFKEEQMEIREKQREINEEQQRVYKFGPRPIASPWDGSYSEITTYLKKIAKDPDSVKIYNLSPVIYLEKDGWVIKCDWGAKNSFGGMIRSIDWFIIINGKVVSMKKVINQ